SQSELSFSMSVMAAKSRRSSATQLNVLTHCDIPCARNSALFRRRLIKLAPALRADIARDHRAAFRRLEFGAFAALLIVLRRVLIFGLGFREFLLLLALCARRCARAEHQQA